MITVGLDFGTHQTKICIENKKGVECKYTFMKFKDTSGRQQYTLPSVISIGSDGKLKYGYLPHKTSDTVIRYFKQGAFCTASEVKMSQDDAMLYSCWYIAYILFDLEEKFGQEFSIQMGAPTDSGHYDKVKQIAVRILASAYKLVEDVFKNDKKKFLDTDIKALKKMTKIETYSDELKNDYGILVFPEAYACLKPLTSRGKIATGMSLMVDIGGGTTDISFFTIQDGKPEVYDFMSIDKGLNYLTNALSKVQDSSISDVTKVSKPLKFMSIGELWHHSKESAQKENVTSIIVKSASEIDISKRDVFIKELAKKVKGLITKLQNEFKAQTDFELSRLMEALQSRPLIYCGGGSTFQTLQVDYSCFKDKRMISYKEWDTKSVEDIKDIVDKKLVPILSTAYGLSISVADDNITKKPFRDIFENMRKDEVNFHYQSEKDHPYDSNYNTATSMYSDWDAYK